MKKVSLFFALLLSMVATNVMAADPIATAVVPDGYYYIRSTVDAFELTTPYIIANGGAMNLVESNADTKTIWKITSSNATSGTPVPASGKKYSITNFATGMNWVAGPGCPLGTAVSSYNIDFTEEGGYYMFHGRSDGNIGNSAAVNATSATAFGRSETGSCNKWYLIPANEKIALYLAADTALTNGKAIYAKTQPGDKLLTTSGDQYSSNAPEPSEGSLKNLIDGDATTFFHGSWSNSTFNKVSPKELYINGLDENVTTFRLRYMDRNCANSNGAIEVMDVYGGTVETPANPNTTAATFNTTSELLTTINIAGAHPNYDGCVDFTIGETGYTALRFSVVGNYNNQSYFHVGDFRLYEIGVIPAEYNVEETLASNLKTAIDNLEAAYAAGTITQELVDAVKDATQAVKNAAGVVVITYQITVGDSVVWTAQANASIGKPYPTVTAPDFVTLTYPEGNVTAAETVELAYTTTYAIAPDAASVTQWYSLDIHGNQGNYPLYRNAEDDQYVRVVYGTAGASIANDYKNGAVENDGFCWALVGNIFTGVQLYNKYNGEYAVQTNDADEKIKIGTEGTVFKMYKPNSSVANSFSLKVENRKYYFNHRSEYVQGWTASDEGSSLRAYPITPATAADKVSYTFSADYGTLIVPFYAEIPEDLEVFTCSSVTSNVLNLTAETSIIKPGVPYIIKSETGSEFDFLNASKLTTPAAATVGLLTGVFEATIAPVSSYVLQNNDDVLGFYQVATDAEPTVGANRCYLTLPEPEAKALFFDEATAIESIHNSEFIIQNNGKFLENGKIVIVKNNAKYNVAGQMIK